MFEPDEDRPDAALVPRLQLLPPLSFQLFDDPSGANDVGVLVGVSAQQRIELSFQRRQARIYFRDRRRSTRCG